MAFFLKKPAIAKEMPSSIRPPVRVDVDAGQTTGFGEGAPEGLPEMGRSWNAEPDTAANFVSMPLPPSKAGVLRFLIAGDLGTPSFPFHLRSLETGLVSAPEIETAAAARWKTIHIVRPPGQVVIEAGPAVGDAWGAFTEPVEVGMLSWISGKLTKWWVLFAIAGGACMLAAAALSILPEKRREVFRLNEDGTVGLSSRDQ
jgi:hypothetical protein